MILLRLLPYDIIYEIKNYLGKNEFGKLMSTSVSTQNIFKNFLKEIMLEEIKALFKVDILKKMEDLTKNEYNEYLRNLFNGCRFLKLDLFEIRDFYNQNLILNAIHKNHWRNRFVNISDPKHSEYLDDLKHKDIILIHHILKSNCLDVNRCDYHSNIRMLSTKQFIYNKIVVNFYPDCKKYLEKIYEKMK